ncbi:MAG: hypothetical protein PWP57_663 [Candidatus Atribacteria bacterium]|nr:hypothetical protein [Candidatus Atribacteria bacterium]
MATRNKRLHKQETVALALLESPTVAEASRRSGVSEKTIYVWLKEPEFQEIFREVKRCFISLTLSRLEGITGEAIETLREIMLTGEGESPRVSASKAILETVLKLYEYEQLEERIAKLEERVNET